MKKIISLIIGISLLMGSFGVVSPLGASAAGYDLVKQLGIMTGYEDGSFGGGDILSRAQFAKVAVVLIDRYFTPFASVSPYSDVPYTYWGAPYIAYASDKGLLSGYPDGSFQPERPVAYEEACKVLLAVLGYETAPSGDWAGAQINTAAQVGILDGIQPMVGQSLTRDVAARMVENTLLTKKKGENGYFIESLGYIYLQNVILIAESTAAEDKVLTSAGEFKINSKLPPDYILLSGDLIVDRYDNILSFKIKEQKVDRYVVKMVLSDKLITYNNDEQLLIKDDTKVFEGRDQSTYSSVKSTLKNGDRIMVYRDTAGRVDYISIERDVILGPVTNISGSYKQAFGISPYEEVKVIRDGTPAAADEVADYDICYYVEDNRLVLAYSEKKTGIYEAALPNKNQPISITLSGENYEIGNVTALNKLSSQGGLFYGDTITLLLDKDGKIADVLSVTENQSKTAFLVDTGLRQVVDEDNHTSNLHYVRLATFDAGEVEYIADQDYSDYRGKAVRMTLSGGRVSLEAESFQGMIYGTFDWSKRQFGNLPVSSDIKIIDTVTYDRPKAGKYIMIYPQRIDGVVLTEYDVLGFEKNAKGELSGLILKSVTNDFYDFGLVIKAKNTTSNYVTAGQYDLLVGGEKKSVATANVAFNVAAGQPALFEFEGESLVRAVSLTALQDDLESADSFYAYTAKAKYRLSEDVLVYRKTSSNSAEYELVPLSEVAAAKAPVRAYYDKTQERGGLIRVIMIGYSK